MYLLKIEEVFALGALSVACLYLVKRHPAEAKVILDMIEGKTFPNQVIESPQPFFIFNKSISPPSQFDPKILKPSFIGDG